jgi:hypothetical protein
MKTRTAKRTRYAVRGSGNFPFDMLRYDASYPFSQTDAAAMEHHRTEARRVELLGMVPGGQPTDERWASFGWRVDWIQPGRSR